MAPTPLPPVAAALQQKVAALWLHALPHVRQRILQLEAAAQAAERGTLTPDQRTEAIATAHNLAGSLGMFGYPLGTQIARTIEQTLQVNSEMDAIWLTQRMRDLRSTLNL